MSETVEKKQLTPDEQKAVLIQAGYSVSEEWIKDAVGTATNADEMSDHLFVLHVATITYLAQEILNIHIQNHVDLEEAISKVFEELKSEIDHRLDGDKIAHSPGAAH